MKDFFEQFGALIGAGIAAACCLGLPVVLAAVDAVGLGFLVYDPYLFLIFVAFVGLNLWLLYRSACRRGDLRPFWLGLTGGLLGAASLWLLVTGLYPMPWAVYTSLVVLLAGSVWDFINGRRAAAAPAEEVCETPAPAEKPDLGRRAAIGAGLSVAAAGTFYGLYKSVEALAPQAEAGEIACWGINECKGQGACSTAFNSCAGQNECKGKGYVYVPEKECYARGGELLKESPAAPSRG